jgi:menaquinone-dependent protoporphyrinogen oxidase
LLSIHREEAAMDRVSVFYATTEGQTRRIAEAIASTLREQGFDSEPIELSRALHEVDWSALAGAVVGASIHGGRHQRAATRFVCDHAQQLRALPGGFFSVSLSAGSKNPSEVAAAHAIAAKFLTAAHWRPARTACFPGALAYTKYGFITRWMLRRIAAREGAPTDTSRDYEFTDWAAVRNFALGVAADVRGASRRASEASDLSVA